MNSESLKKFVLISIWCTIFILLAEIFEGCATRYQILAWRQIIMFFICFVVWSIMGPDKKSLTQLVKEKKAWDKAQPLKVKKSYFFHIFVPLSVWVVYLHI